MDDSFKKSNHDYDTIYSQSSNGQHSLNASADVTSNNFASKPIEPQTISHYNSKFYENNRNHAFFFIQQVQKVWCTRAYSEIAHVCYQLAEGTHKITSFRYLTDSHYIVSALSGKCLIHNPLKNITVHLRYTDINAAKFSDGSPLPQDWPVIKPPN